MTKNETVKGIVGILFGVSVGLCWLPLSGLLGEYWSMLVVFIYIMQLAVVAYPHFYLHNKIWYAAVLITLCVSNILNCLAWEVQSVCALNESTKSSNIMAGFLVIFVNAILIFSIVVTLIIILECIISFHKRKGSFQ